MRSLDLKPTSFSPKISRMSKDDKENKVMHFTQRMDDLVKT